MIWGASTWIRVYCCADQEQCSTAAQGVAPLTIRKVIICFAGVWVGRPLISTVGRRWCAARGPSGAASESDNRLPCIAPGFGDQCSAAGPSRTPPAANHTAASRQCHCFDSYNPRYDRRPAIVSKVVGYDAFLTHAQVYGSHRGNSPSAESKRRAWTSAEFKLN